MIWKYILKTIGVVGIIFVTLSVYFLAFSVTIEGYYRLNPWIDTRTSDSYSEENFNQIKIGMDTTEIKNIIGNPYSRQITDWHNDSLKHQYWYFTGDGKFEKGDFAWIGRELYISNTGIVTEILRTVHHD